MAALDSWHAYQAATALVSKPRKHGDRIHWQFDFPGGTSEWEPYYEMQKSRVQKLLDETIKAHPGGLDGLLENDRFVPEQILRAARARKNPGRPRRFNPEARELAREMRLARTKDKLEEADERAAAKGYTRKGERPVYNYGESIPETGHRFTVTRETLEKLVYRMD